MSWVAQPRTCRFKMRGPDVRAYKRALKKSGIRPWSSDTGPQFGMTMRAQVMKFQRRQKIHVDGVIGPNTYGKMFHLFDGYSLLLLKKTRLRLIDPKTAAQRRIVNIAFYEKNQAAYIHYTQGIRRMDCVRYGWSIPIAYSARHVYTDCSAFVTWVYKQARCPDPNGRGYDGYGYTGTLIAKGQRVLAGWARGDLVFYGYPVNHVAIYIGDGRVVSHGSEYGPYLLPARYRSDLIQVRRYRLV